MVGWQPREQEGAGAEEQSHAVSCRDNPSKRRQRGDKMPSPMSDLTEDKPDIIPVRSPGSRVSSVSEVFSRREKGGGTEPHCKTSVLNALKGRCRGPNRM